MTNRIVAGEPVPLRLGALAPVSRPGFLEAGRHLSTGIELAVQEINEADGIEGRPLELLLRDTAGFPERGTAAIRDLAAQGAVAVVGEYHSVVAHAAAGAAVEARLPFVCASAVLDALAESPSGLVARIAPAQSYCWRVYADYLAATGYCHVALVVEPNRYWTSGARLLQASLAERGVRVIEIAYAASEGAANTDVVLEIAAAEGVDAVMLLVGYPEPAATLVKALRADVRLAGLRIGDPAGRAEFAPWQTLLGADGADVPFLRYLPSELGSHGVRVGGQLRQALGEEPSFVAFEGYDAVQAVAQALRLGGPERDAVARALQGLEFGGTRGPVRLSPDPGGVLQWTWPPVQVAAHCDPRRPQEVSVLYQA